MGQYHKAVFVSENSFQAVSPSWLKLMEFSWMYNHETFLFDLALVNRSNEAIMETMPKFDLKDLVVMMNPDASNGVRMFIAGDYGDENQFIDMLSQADPDAFNQALDDLRDEDPDVDTSKINAYTLLSSSKKNYSLRGFDDKNPILPESFSVDKFYKTKNLAWINHTKKLVLPVSQYLSDFKKAYQIAFKNDADYSEVMKEVKNYIPHPMCLLTSQSNNRGGGDYRLRDGNDAEIGAWIVNELTGSWAGDLISMDIVPMSKGQPAGDTEYSRYDLLFPSYDIEFSKNMQLIVNNFFKSGSAVEFRKMKDIDSIIQDTFFDKTNQLAPSGWF